MISRNDFGICVFNKSEVLVTGGRDDNNEVTNNCFLFNTISETFEEVKDMNTRRCGHVLVNIEGVVYSIGGANENREYLDTIEILNPVTEQWDKSDVKLNVARYNHRAVAHKNFIYIFGGYRRCRYINAIERFNVKTGQMELLNQKLRALRSDFAVGKIDSDVYIFGGYTMNGSTASCEIFNLETEEVREGESLPFSDWGFTACVL